MIETVSNNDNLEFDKLILMFKETRELIEKASIETDKKFQETRELIEKSSLETDKKIQETDKFIKEISKELKEVDTKRRKTETMFNQNWSQFVESLVEGNITELLNQRGIAVQNTAQNEKSFYNGRQYEIDIIARNGNDVVAVEVKTTLSTDDVKEFIEELKVFKEVFPIYSGKTIYGALAYIKVKGPAVSYAIKQGLFVIRATQDSARIINEKGFQPKAY